MPIRWGNSNVREFQYNMPPINVGKSNSRKNKPSNIKNRRYMKPVPANNTRRQAYRNPNYNPNAAIQQLRMGQQAINRGIYNHGVNVPQRYGTANNALLGAQKLHNNLYGKKPPPTRNAPKPPTPSTVTGTPESTREENVWTPPLTPPLNTPYVNMNNWHRKTNKTNKKRVLKGATAHNNTWSNLNF
jgi:hypothetical protein